MRSRCLCWVQWELCRSESLVQRSLERTAGWEWILQTCQWCCTQKPEEDIRCYWITGQDQSFTFKRELLYDVFLYWGSNPLKNCQRDYTSHCKYRSHKMIRRNRWCLICGFRLQNEFKQKCLCETQQEIEREDVILLSQQVAHTQRVLPGWIWSQSIRAAGHVVLSLGKPTRFTARSDWLFNFPISVSKNKTAELRMHW